MWIGIIMYTDKYTWIVIHNLLCLAGHVYSLIVYDSVYILYYKWGKKWTVLSTLGDAYSEREWFIATNTNQ